MKKGRDLELLVRDIKALKIPDSVIKSPEFVLDADTNSRREVDVGIRCKTENGEIYIAIECRDRSSKQDITWIEQLITKKNSIKANILIAVTSSSFTDNAMLKAKKNGVAIRDITKFTPNEIIAWSKETYVLVTSISKKIKGIFFLLDKDYKPLKPIESYRYFLEEYDSEVSFEEVIAYFANDNVFLSASKKLNEKKDIFEFRATLDVSGVYIIISRGEKIRVNSIKLHLIGEKIFKKLPLTSGFDYVDMDSKELLAKGYDYNAGKVKVSSVIVDTEESTGEWKIDFMSASTEGEVLESIAVLLKDPLAIKKLSLKAGEGL